MAINISVRYNGGFLFNIILLTLYYYHRRIRLNAIKRSCLGSLCSHLNALMRSSKGLDAFRFLFKQSCQKCCYLSRASNNLSRRYGARICLAQRGWDSGFESYYGIKTGSMIFEVVAVVIRQYSLKNCLWQMFLGANGKWPRGVILPCFFIITHTDSVTQSIQSVSSLV